MIEAKAKPDLSLRTLLDAVFPCGYYCGALGWLDPNSNFAFSVPIRTLTQEESPSPLPIKFTLGIGVGITIDSNPQQEWQIKSAFITETPTELGLFDTIRVKGQKPLRLAAHLGRLRHSASVLRIPFVAERVVESAE